MQTQGRTCLRAEFTVADSLDMAEIGERMVYESLRQMVEVWTCHTQLLAAFVADVLNSQLIPAIVLLNYGTLDVPMPELVFKLPQEGVTLERVQVLKTALEIKGMRIKKSEAYEFMGFAQPAEGDDVFEAASDGGDMAGLAGMLAKGKGKPQDVTVPDNDPPKPKKKVKPSTADDAEPVSAARTIPTDPAQEWLAPIKQKFLEARRAGASMADLKQMLLTMHPNTKALARAFANNILAGFAGESEEVTAAGSNDDSRRRTEPIEMPDGTKCYTENCERHDNEEAAENETIAEIEIDFEFSKEGNWRDEFIEFYKNELAGKAVVVENTGHTITFLNSGSAARLAAKGVRNQKRAETGKKLKEAISKANIKSVEPTTHKERESKKRAAMIESNDLYYTFATPIKINGRKHEVLIYALHGKDNKDEKALRFYEFSVSEK